MAEAEGDVRYGPYDASYAQQLTRSTASRLAPRRTSIATTSTWSLSVDKINAVAPPCTHEHTDASWRRHLNVHNKWRAFWKGNVLLLSRQHRLQRQSTPAHSQLVHCK